MLKRVFDIDIERCACGGKLKFVADIEQPEVESWLSLRCRTLTSACVTIVGISMKAFYRYQQKYQKIGRMLMDFVQRPWRNFFKFPYEKPALLNYKAGFVDILGCCWSANWCRKRESNSHGVTTGGF